MFKNKIFQYSIISLLVDIVIFNFSMELKLNTKNRFNEHFVYGIFDCFTQFSAFFNTKKKFENREKLPFKVLLILHFWVY